MFGFALTRIIACICSSSCFVAGCDAHASDDWYPQRYIDLSAAVTLATAEEAKSLSTPNATLMRKTALFSQETKSTVSVRLRTIQSANYFWGALLSLSEIHTTLSKARAIVMQAMGSVHHKPSLGAEYGMSVFVAGWVASLAAHNPLAHFSKH